ncbi:hypothetical protein A2U01_0068504, partial [Trifolium medium]|nr:hypothetical protein [Trifolium medium]
LSHLSLITNLCNAEHVPIADGNNFEDPFKELTREDVGDFIRTAAGLQYIPFADDDDDFMDYANADLQHVLHHHIPNAPEMESFPAPTHDVNVLAKMLWKIDMSTQ